nr:hypothetical protein [Candidatus Electrothrix aestuarii]
MLRQLCYSFLYRFESGRILDLQVLQGSISDRVSLRDAKQYTGLTHCQARSENKLYFHFNSSLTAVSIAKANFYDSVENQGTPFSMRDITDYYSAKLFLDRILSKLDIELVSDKFDFDYEDLLNTAAALA